MFLGTMPDNPIIQAWEKTSGESGGFESCQEFIDYLKERYGDNVNYMLTKEGPNVASSGTVKTKDF